mgnify:CR=1 FL=1
MYDNQKVWAGERVLGSHYGHYRIYFRHDADVVSKSVVVVKNKNMLKTKKSVLFLIALVLLVTVVVYYQYTRDILQPLRGESGDTMPSKVTGKEVSAVVSYDTPGDYKDILRFVVTVNEAGMIERIETLDDETNQIPEKKKEFNQQINTLLQGKKLSELSAIDKVGTSSMTTDAFNEALPKLQASL